MRGGISKGGRSAKERTQCQHRWEPVSSFVTQLGQRALQASPLIYLTPLWHLERKYPGIQPQQCPSAGSHQPCKAATARTDASERKPRPRINSGFDQAGRSAAGLHVPARTELPTGAAGHKRDLAGRVVKSLVLLLHSRGVRGSRSDETDGPVSFGSSKISPPRRPPVRRRAHLRSPPARRS